MKTANSFISALALAFLIATLAGCSKPAADKPADAPDKTEATPKAGVTVDAATQDRIGLKTAAPTAMQWQPEIKAYGRVVDPAPLLDSLMELARAEMTFDTSHQELERAKQLKKDNNISERAFQDAEATYKQNLAAVGALNLKLQNSWGRRIPEMMGPEVVPPGTERKWDAFLKNYPDSAMLIRVDLPVGERLDPWTQTARIISLAENIAPVTATYFDKLPAMDAQTQQQEMLFAADKSAANKLTPGEAVTAIVKTSGDSVSGVVVPTSAVLRHEGRGWVYVQAGTNQFVRVEISLDHPTDQGWFVSENVSTTNRVVITGAQTILSAELSGGGFNTGARD